ncbi:DNA mismatch repair protein MutH, partial [Klebsiella pneumoniae]
DRSHRRPRGDNPHAAARFLSEKEFYRRSACPPFLVTTRLIFCSALGVAYNCCFLFCRTLNNVICMDNRS